MLNISLFIRSVCHKEICIKASRWHLSYCIFFLNVTRYGADGEQIGYHSHNVVRNKPLNRELKIHWLPLKKPFKLYWVSNFIKFHFFFFFFLYRFKTLKYLSKLEILFTPSLLWERQLKQRTQTTMMPIYVNYCFSSPNMYKGQHDTTFQHHPYCLLLLFS